MNDEETVALIAGGHVFVSPSARVRSLGRFAVAGSDHFAIAAEVAFPSNEPGEPQPDGDDRLEARELVSERREDLAALKSP